MRREFPEGSGKSVSSDNCLSTYFDKVELIGVARLIYKKIIKKTIVLMSDGSTRERNDDFEKIVDELADQDITIELDDQGNPREREADSVMIMSRMFDGDDWLTGEEETVFKNLPIVPMYAHFDIDDGGKITYKSLTHGLMDAQRSYNMLRSREMEDVANSPVAKYWATRKQMAHSSDKKSAQTLNTNRDPLQLYTHDQDNPGPPIFMGGAQVKPRPANRSPSGT